MKFSETRRNTIKKMMAGGAMLSLSSLMSNRLEAANAAMGKELSDKINHSACKWCYNDIPLEELCEKGKAFGLQSIYAGNWKVKITAIDTGFYESNSSSCKI